MRILNADNNAQFYLIQIKGGLSGDQELIHYPCLLTNKKLFAFIGSTPVVYFNSSTVLNLANFGEKIGSKSLFLILDGDHTERAVFNVIFRIIDAKKINLRSEII